MNTLLCDTLALADQTSPDFARLRQTSHEGARVLPARLEAARSLNAPFLNGCLPGEFREGKRPIKEFWETAHQGPKTAIEEGKRPIKVNGLFAGTASCWKTAPLKRPIKRSMILGNGKSARNFTHREFFRGRLRGMSVPKMLGFSGFGGPDRSFWPGLRRDVRPKTSSSRCFLVSGFCSRVLGFPRPQTGPRTPNPRKEVSGSKHPHFHASSKREFSDKKKVSFFLQENTGKMGIF